MLRNISNWVYLYIIYHISYMLNNKKIKEVVFCSNLLRAICSQFRKPAMFFSIASIYILRCISYFSWRVLAVSIISMLRETLHTWWKNRGVVFIRISHHVKTAINVNDYVFYCLRNSKNGTRISSNTHYLWYDLNIFNIFQNLSHSIVQ